MIPGNELCPSWTPAGLLGFAVVRPTFHVSKYGVYVIIVEYILSDETGATKRCDCSDMLGFTGERCEQFKGCAVVSCQNGGKCLQMDASKKASCQWVPWQSTLVCPCLPPHMFLSARCLANFKGPLCEMTMPDHCVSFCLNGGSCLECDLSSAHGDLPRCTKCLWVLKNGCLPRCLCWAVSAFCIFPCFPDVQMASLGRDVRRRRQAPELCQLLPVSASSVVVSCSGSTTHTHPFLLLDVASIVVPVLLGIILVMAVVGVCIYKRRSRWVIDFHLMYCVLYSLVITWLSIAQFVV